MSPLRLSPFHAPVPNAATGNIRHTQAGGADVKVARTKGRPRKHVTGGTTNRGHVLVPLGTGWCCNVCGRMAKAQTASGKFAVPASLLSDLCNNTQHLEFAAQEPYTSYDSDAAFVFGSVESLNQRRN